VDTTVTWSGNLKFAPGSGAVRTWSKIIRAHSATQQRDETVPCGLSTPDFAGNGNEKFGLTFPAALFDRALPRSVAGFSVSSTAAGDSFESLGATTIFLGLAPLNPPTQSWPSLGGISGSDHDADGKPGVTALAKSGAAPSGGNYSLIPFLSYDRLYLALRHVTTLNGTLDGCSNIQGTAVVRSIDWHALGCHSAGGSDCNTLERNLFDDEWLRYRPGAATFRMQKLAAAATCADVRSALP
jgi:hypothetical protein